MPFNEFVARLTAASRALPIAVRYLATIAIVLAFFLIRQFADAVLPPGYPFLFFFVAVLLCAALFDRGSGLVATATSAALAAYFYLPPIGSLHVEEGRQVVALTLFVAIGATMTFIIEALHVAVARLSASETSRGLLLREFRHRTRNDINGLVALLQLRARAAPSEAARESLHDAANYAFALARVHTRLAPDGDSDDLVSVTTREFIAGLCADIEGAQVGVGLRPVAVIAEAEAHYLEADRAVPLGMVLNEAVTNALK
jgi:hypothetical protein